MHFFARFCWGILPASSSEFCSFVCVARVGIFARKMDMVVYSVIRFCGRKCCPFLYHFFVSETSQLFAKFAPKIFFAAIASKHISGANFGFQARWRLDRFLGENAVLFCIVFFL